MEQTLTARYSESNIMDYLSLYQPKEIPIAPQELIEFRRLDKYSKTRQSEAFFKQDFITEYLKDKWEAELYNRDGFYKIYEMLLEFPNFKNQFILKLSQFKKTTQFTTAPFLALRIDFKNFPFDEKTPQPTKEPERVDWD